LKRKTFNFGFGADCSKKRASCFKTSLESVKEFSKNHREATFQVDITVNRSIADTVNTLLLPATGVVKTSMSGELPVERFNRA
jgi:hypothetical protein